MSATRTPRARIACDACKRGKRKCDASVPACGLCERQTRECIYSAKEEQPKRRKVQDLETEIARLRQCIKQPEITAVDSENTTEAQLQSPSAQKHDQTGVQKSLDFTDRLNGVTRSCVEPDPSQIATSEFGLTGHKNSGTTAVPVYGPAGVYSMSMYHDSTYIKGSMANASLLEPKHDPLVYLQGQPALRQKVTNAFHHKANRYGFFVDSELYEVNGFFVDVPLPLRFLYCTILATGAKLADDPELLYNHSNFADYAKDMAMPALSSSSGMEVLQGLIILAWLGMVNGDSLQMLVYNSLAGSLVTYLGLDVKIPVLSRQNSFENGQRKDQVRTFWAYVFNDRIISAALGKLPGIRWRHVQTPAYGSMSTFGTWAPADLYFDTTCRLWRLFDIVMDDIYAPSFKELSQTDRSQLTRHCEEQIHNLYTETDPRIKLHSGTSKELPEAHYLHIGFHTAIILLNRPLLERGMTEDHQRPLQAMATSANAIYQAIQRYCKDYSFADSPPYLVLHITRACVVFLLLATSSTVGIQRSAANGLKHCLKAIDQCAQSWRHLADRSIRLIQELAARWQVVKSLPMHHSNMAYGFNDTSGLRAESGSMHQHDTERPYQESVECDLDMYNEYMWSNINSIELE